MSTLMLSRPSLTTSRLPLTTDAGRHGSFLCSLNCGRMEIGDGENREKQSTVLFFQISAQVVTLLARFSCWTLTNSTTGSEAKNIYEKELKNETRSARNQETFPESVRQIIYKQHERETDIKTRKNTLKDAATRFAKLTAILWTSSPSSCAVYAPHVVVSCHV